MEKRFDHKGALTFIGYYTQIKPGEGYEKCPEFWNKEYGEKYSRLWATMKSETEVEKAILDNAIGLYAICSENERGFEYWIAGLYKGGAVPEGLSLFTFPESDWVMFSTKGPLPHSLQELNTYVWEVWLKENEDKYSVNNNSMLEVYSPGKMDSPDYECGIWIPIIKKEDPTPEIVSTMTLTGIL